MCLDPLFRVACILASLGGASQTHRVACCAMLFASDVPAGIAATVRAAAAAFLSLLLVDYVLAVLGRRVFRRDEICAPPPPRRLTSKNFVSPTVPGRAAGTQAQLGRHDKLLWALVCALFHRRSLRFLLVFMVLPFARALSVDDLRQ